MHPILAYEEKMATYQTGEVTLTKIGKKLGNLSPTMVNKILDKGYKKFKYIFIPNGKENILGSLEQIRIKVAKKYVKAMSRQKMQTNADEILKGLCKEQVIGKHDTKYISQREKDALVILAEYNEDVMEAILLEDIEQDDNLYKTFQTAISKAAFKKGK